MQCTYLVVGILIFEVQWVDVKSFGSATMFRTGGTGLGYQIIGRDYEDISLMAVRATLEDIQGESVVNDCTNTNFLSTPSPNTPKMTVCSPSS